MCSLNKETDECIAERFKRDYTEQFHILVRMHLSFLLDINTDENECLSEKGKLKKFAPFTKKSKFRGVMEGAPLTQEGICQVYQLIEFLKKEDNMKSEGIFRRTGSIERQQDLRNFLNQGVTLQLEESTYSVHDCASVLKGFLAELPDPLLTEAHFPVYCQIAESCGIAQKPTQEIKLLEAIQLLLLLLPTDNKVLLKDILELLHLTASFESFNRMSADNLAKLFTPHLLCPRKLSPENLLKDSQTLFGIISFMITKTPELFKIPPKLVLEFRARYEKKKVLSPTKKFNESVSDAANTVFTFVDQERTAKENESNPTETALAQLYAHIQSLPESSKKRKLVKQFNKENGHGTPLQVIKSGHSKNKSFGDSIKKHIFQKSLAKKRGYLLRSSSSDEVLDSPSNSQSIVARARLFCHHNCDTSNDRSGEENPPKKPKMAEDATTSPDADVSGGGGTHAHKVCVTSTPACVPMRACRENLFTPDQQSPKSMSPITRSTQRMTRAMQETMMTPRSRKPVLLLSGTNINTLYKPEQTSWAMDNVTEEVSETPNVNDQKEFKKSKSEGDIGTKSSTSKMNNSEPPTVLSETFKDYLSNRDILTLSDDEDSSFSSRTDDFNSTDDLNDWSQNKLSESLLYCLDGNKPDDDVDMTENDEKELLLKPKQFDANGTPIVFETSF
ncbi:unnamed protein product [Phaedon cochleariae]|uniref:Rho-GAP domain-containing protein n=1 Tax=Phaedon cochleariae TaxID=80249 RepID=A0A9P0DFY6_PHACE|nr:unnamed protein product [Phaedon cochleariae]